MLSSIDFKLFALFSVDGNNKSPKNLYDWQILCNFADKFGLCMQEICIMLNFWLFRHSG